MIEIKVDQSQFYTETVEVMSMKGPLFDFTITTVPVARKLNDPNPEWGVVSVAVTGAQRGKVVIPSHCWNRPYALPYAIFKKIQEEIQEMINTGFVSEA